MSKWLEGLLAVAVLVIVGGSIYDRLNTKPVGGASTPAVEAPAVRNAPRVPVSIKAPVVTLQGDSKARLKLPEAVIADKNEQVIAASQVKGDLHPQTVSTVIDTETGKVTSFTKIDPYPWFAVETRGNVGVAYGYKFRSLLPEAHAVTRLQLGYDVVRVKALTVGVTATVDTDRDAFVGVGVKYQW